VQVGSQAMADRYTYLPQIGLTIAVTWGAADLLAGWRFRRWAGAAVSVALVGTLLGAAWRQTDYWRDGETLWRRALSCTERNAVAHNNLATLLMDRNKPSDAADHYRKAVEILPAFSVLRDNLGNALEAEGKSEEAAAEYRRAQEGPILDAVEHYRLAQTLASTPAAKATVYNNLGNALAALGREEEAAAEFRRALECKPEYAEARNNLANVLAARGRLDEAIAEYRRALADNPDYVEAQGNLGAALARLGRLDEAVARFRKVLELSPDNAAAYNNLGMVFERQGNLADAIRQWREAVRLAPSNVHYVNRLARALATAPDAALRDGAAAVELAQWAVQRTKGREAVPFDTLAAALAEAGQFPAAIDAARGALRLAEEGHAPTEDVTRHVGRGGVGGHAADDGHRRVVGAAVDGEAVAAR